jgi:hypothetical protein
MIFFLDTADFHAGAALGVPRVGEIQRGQSQAADERGLAEVQQQLPVARRVEFDDIVREIIRFLAADEHPLRR